MKLVVITGPIASGKTTLAFGLAAFARERGLKAAAIDMDDLVEMVAGDWEHVGKAHRLLAPRLAAVLLNELRSAGYDFVAVAGSTLAAYEQDAIVAHLYGGLVSAHVRLSVRIEEAGRRAQADSSRVATKNPDVLRRHYDRIDWERLPAADFHIDTDGRPAGEVLHLVAASVLV
jgi:hypothetical protein